LLFFWLTERKLPCLENPCQGTKQQFSWSIECAAKRLAALCRGSQGAVIWNKEKGRAWPALKDEDLAAPESCTAGAKAPDHF
jgi:hypothetical protein